MTLNTFSTIEDVELHVFKEISEDVDAIREELAKCKHAQDNDEKLTDFSDDVKYFCKVSRYLENNVDNASVYKVIIVEEDFIIFADCDRFAVCSENILSLKVGDIVCYVSEYRGERVIYKVDESMKKIKSTHLVEDKIEAQVIATDKIIYYDKLLTEITRINLDNKKRREDNKMQQDEAIAKRQAAIENYRSSGVFDGAGYKTTKNSIAFLDEYSDDRTLTIVVVSRTIQSLISLDTLESSRRYFSKSVFVRSLINDKIDFEYHRADGVVVKVKFEGERKIFVNDVEIKGGRLDVLIEKVGNNVTEEYLKLLSSLNGMKFKLLELTKIKFSGSGRSLKMPINFIPTDTWHFKVQFLGKEVVLDWKDVRRLFFEANSISHLNEHLSTLELMEVCKTFGMSKQDLFDYFKKLSMLETLKNEFI